MQAQTIQRIEALQMRLKEMGIATPQQLEQAKQEQVKTQERFGVVLARLGIIREAESGKRLAVQLGWLPRRLEASEAPAVGSQRIPPDVCRTHRVVPIQEDANGHIVLASDDPFTAFALEWLERRCGVTLDLTIIREQDLESLLTRPQQAVGASPSPAPRAALSPPPSAPAVPAPSGPPTAPSAAPPKAPAPVTASMSPPRPTPARPIESVGRAGETGKAKPKTDGGPPSPGPAAGVSASDEPVIRLVDSVLSEAVRMRASDVHVEPMADRLKVRYRIDGVLHDVNSPPKPLQGPVISRIKIMGGLNIAEKRLPQDGRLQLRAEGRPLDVRISILPALHGEAIVMRLLDRSHTVHQLAELGMAEADAQRWEQFIHRPYGMILVTGPTGSGKTTTLYATLAALNRPDRKLITVEDPVEYQMPGVNQVQVRVAVGLTFAAGLRSMLRQAPDVIMVGEIRDQETAQIAIQAALTGHLVFSTLHTNDAPSAVTRLIDMGIPPFLVASTVQAVLAQRLVRRVCSSCVQRRAITPEEADVLGEPVLSELVLGGGCDQCHQSGYYGRLAIYELLGLSDAIRRLVVSKSSAPVLRQQAVREGMHSLRDSGLMKVREGLTTITEVLRVTPEEGSA